MLRIYLWLAQPHTQRRLGLMLRVVVGVVAIWTASTACGMFKVRASVATQRGQLDRLHTKADALDAQVNLQRRVSRRRHEAPAREDISDSTTVADTMSRLASGAGAQIQSIRFVGSEGSGHRTRKHAKAAAESDDQSGGDGALSHSDSFECEATGQFPALLEFLDVVADSPLAIELTDIDITRMNQDPQSNASILRMKMVGRLQP